MLKQILVKKGKAWKNKLEVLELVPESEFLDHRKTVTDKFSAILNFLNMEMPKRAFRFQTVKKI